MKSIVTGLVGSLLVIIGVSASSAADEPSGSPVRVGVFDVDASPPIGSPLAYDPATAVETPLRCRGIVILGAEKPVVLCAVDWIGISNGGQTVFRQRLADAAGTSPERVAVHALHQHDAPSCDFSAEELLAREGLGGTFFDPAFARGLIDRVAAAVKKAAADARPVTHVGLGEARVEEVASNRRILGADGKVKYVRYTATKDAKIRAYPEGVIDPILKLIGFWDGDRPIAVLTYYATHPQSYYRTGRANPDFPGLARNQRQEVTGIPHVHFNGAGGNIGAGKYNDGSHEMRAVLAGRMADGMRRAWDSVRKAPITARDVGWTVEPVRLPPASYLDEARLVEAIKDKKQPVAKREVGRPPSGLAPEVLIWRDDRPRLPTAWICPNPAHARRAVRRVSARSPGHAPRPLHSNGRLRRVRAGVHWDSHRLRSGRLRNPAVLVERRSPGGGRLARWLAPAA